MKHITGRKAGERVRSSLLICQSQPLPVNKINRHLSCLMYVSCEIETETDSETEEGYKRNIWHHFPMDS